MQTVHGPAPTKWAAIRYSLFFLISAIALAFAFDCALHLFLTVARIVRTQAKELAYEELTRLSVDTL